MRISPARAGRRGFTLVELMVVVAVVGVLAAIAVVGYIRWVRASKVSEAIFMVNAIRTAEEHYYSDQLSYLNVSLSVDASYPKATPGMKKTQWGQPCSNCQPGVEWSQLGIDTQPVQFGYAVIAGNETTTPSTLPPGFTAAAFTGRPWYIVKARGDTDGNGVFCEVWGFANKTDLLVVNSGELSPGGFRRYGPAVVVRLLATH